MTDDPRVPRRRYLAERILASYAGQVSGRDVLAEVSSEDFDDPVLEELLDLYEHEPAKSRFFGLAGAAYDQYIADVRALAAAVVEDPRAVPRSVRRQ